MRSSRPDSRMTSWPVIPRETEPWATKRGMSEAGRKTLSGGVRTRGEVSSRGKGRPEGGETTESS